MKRCLLLALLGSFAVVAAPKLDSARLDADLSRLRSLSRELGAMEKQMFVLNNQVKVKKRGFFTADENAAIESLLFRYLVCRDSLWEMVASYREAPEKKTSPDLRAQAFILGMNAALKLAHYSSKMVLTYIDEDEVIAKLNEAHPAFGIPRDTYDRLLHGITDQENLQDIEASWQLFIEEAGNPATAVYKVSVADTRYRALIAENYRLRESSQKQIAFILKEKAILLPDVANWMRHTKLSGLARNTWRLVDDKLYTAKGVLFENVSHLRRPMVTELPLTKHQIRAVRKELQPGDLLLTFSSGYMSNIFLPGQFKHGIVYVGTPEQRRAMGLDMDAFAGLPKAKREYIEQELGRTELAGGEPAELIESVAAGVIYNSLDNILGGYAYRMVVLRPRVTDQERIQALAKVYRLLGSEYDFGFDFDDASYICCTEVIYRSFHGKSDIRFPLTKRMGIPTLSADDIINYALGDGRGSFEPILFAGPRSGSKDKAEVVVGDPAAERLVATMRGQQQ